ncbi:hypothetical protein KY361_00735 [Candidatus Woesearchaeota archaeon]|nr:hypothetical protein [Candidatus Woesearchaeota archaeon]
MHRAESLREFLFEDFIRLFAESKGVVLDSRGVIIDPGTDRRYAGIEESIIGLVKSVKRSRKFFGIATAGNSAELRGPLELIVKDADFSKSEEVQEEPFRVRRYPGVKSDGLDFRGVYAGVFAFFNGVYHEIDLVHQDSVRKSAELGKHIMGSTVLVRAIKEGYKTPYTPGFLVFTLPDEGYAQQVEEALLRVLEFYGMRKDFIVRRKQRKVYTEPVTMDDGETEVNKYNVIVEGSKRASEFAENDYSIDGITYVTDDPDHPSERGMERRSNLIFHVDGELGHDAHFHESMPPIVAVGSSKDAFSKIRDGLTMTIRPEIAERLYDWWNRREQEKVMTGMPAEEALKMMGLFDSSGISLRDHVSPKILCSYANLVAGNGAELGVQSRAQ